MPSVTLARIPASDIDELRTMACRYWEELMPNAAVIQDPERRAVYFADQFRLDDDRSIHWWAITEQARIGFARVDLWKNHDGPGATIRDLYIDHEYRQRGYGRALVEVIVEELAARNVHRVDLNVREDNPVAFTFWQSVGFELSLYHLRKYL